MALRFLIPWLCLFFIIFYCSAESTLPINDMNKDKYSDDLPLYTHPLGFITHICNRQQQYPLKITEKYCSKFFQSNKSQTEQQRGKRVGWTISV